MTRRRLVVTGDDFGAAPEVNAGVVRAHREGILTSTSLMVAGPAAADAVERARACPSLAVGLHLVVSEDRPVASGFRQAWRALSRAGRAALAGQIEAQLAAFSATGLPLAHVDGHLNMHLHPAVLPILVALAPRFGIRAMRLTRDPLGRALRDGRHVVRKSLEGLVFGVLAAWAAPRLGAAGIAVADRVYGLHQVGHVDEPYLLELAAELPGGTSEVYCHPAEGGSSQGAGELAALVSPRVRVLLDRREIERVSYRDLGGSSP